MSALRYCRPDAGAVRSSRPVAPGPVPSCWVGERSLPGRLQVPDRSGGGTRSGAVLAAFVDRWGQRGAARRAVVVVFSDGRERGDTELLGAQMDRLSRLAHRLVWVDPHAGKDGYAPVRGGIVAALPYLDDLLAGHSLATLEKLLEVIRDA